LGRVVQKGGPRGVAQAGSPEVGEKKGGGWWKGRKRGRWRESCLRRRKATGQGKRVLSGGKEDNQPLQEKRTLLGGGTFERPAKGGEKKKIDASLRKKKLPKTGTLGRAPGGWQT